MATSGLSKYRTRGWGLTASLLNLLVLVSCGQGQEAPDRASQPLGSSINVSTSSGNRPPELQLQTPPISRDSLRQVEEDESLAELVAWCERIIRRNLPPTYEDDRHWDKQKEVWDGIKFRREGLKIETERRKKKVNAGTWTRYSISLVNPDETLSVQLNQLETLSDGRLQFSLSVECALDVFGRLSQWVRDIQVISLSANADAACRLTLDGTVEFHLNPLKLPPDVTVEPHIDRAHVELTYYRVRRISQIGGDWAKLLGRGLERTLDEKLEDLNGKLADKINRQLDKHSDKLSFSAQDWLRAKLRLSESVKPDQAN